MVSLTSFSFVLVFILVLIGDSTAQTQVATGGSGFETARKNLPILGKEAYDSVPAAAEVGNISRLEGRKMLVKWDLARKTVSEEGLDRKESAKISGEGILNVSRKLRNRNPHRHRKAKVTAGFTVFRADYHIPKSHPPKNN